MEQYTFTLSGDRQTMEICRGCNCHTVNRQVTYYRKKKLKRTQSLDSYLSWSSQSKAKGKLIRLNMASINQVLCPSVKHSYSHCRSNFAQRCNLLCHMRKFHLDKVATNQIEGSAPKWQQNTYAYKWSEQSLQHTTDKFIINLAKSNRPQKR